MPGHCKVEMWAEAPAMKKKRVTADWSKGFEETAAIQKFLGHPSLEITAIDTEMSVEALRRVYSACHPAERSWKKRHS